MVGRGDGGVSQGYRFSHVLLAGMQESGDVGLMNQDLTRQRGYVSIPSRFLGISRRSRGWRIGWSRADDATGKLIAQ